MPPSQIKIYHIVHVDRLASIISDGCLLSDRVISQRSNNGSMIGLNNIKQRRLNELTLSGYPSLYVGDCVPFYFCPRSVMLYLIHCKNPALAYQGGQGDIIHLQADFYQVVNWATANRVDWVFTDSNAGSRYFEDFNDLADLVRLNWEAIQSNNWSTQKEGKQAEFLFAHKFPWHLIERIGVYDNSIYTKVANDIQNAQHHPFIQVMKDWYY